MAVNLDSAFLLVKHAVRAMRQSRRGGGHIVMVSSTAAQRGQPFHCDYAAAKGAIISMVKGLAVELAPERIYVNCVAPGWVGTEEIAAPIVFLCSPLASFITGEVFNVNGGAVMAG